MKKKIAIVLLACLGFFNNTFAQENQDSNENIITEEESITDNTEAIEAKPEENTSTRADERKKRQENRNENRGDRQDDRSERRTERKRNTANDIASDSIGVKNEPIFQGETPYRTWAIGVQAGAMFPSITPGGKSDFNEWHETSGYTIYLQKFFTHSFSAKFNFSHGRLSGYYDPATDESGNGNPGSDPTIKPEFATTIDLASSFTFQVDISALLYRRQTRFAFYTEFGYGFMSYSNDLASSQSSTSGFVPINLGMKFKLNDRFNLDLTYGMNFAQSDDVDFHNYNGNNDRWSYATIGGYYSFGKKSKSNLDWVNPYAAMYDDIKSKSLKPEVEALKKRVDSLEKSLEQIVVDTDNDGVPDHFDKEPNTPPGVPTDGAGRTIVVVAAAVDDPNAGKLPHTQNELTKRIQFKVNSAKLQANSKPAIEELAKYLLENNSKVLIEGHTSEDGPYGWNMELSKYRAETVKKALIQMGVPKSNISTVGHGPQFPIASNETPEGKDLNRRVEIKVIGGTTNEEPNINVE